MQDVQPNRAPADRKAELADLVRRAAGGERAAMEALLMRAQEVAYRFSLLVCGHPQDAEDVMQEALLKTYTYVGQISAPEAFRTWLYTTVRNACLMKRRRHVGEPAAFVPIEQDSSHDGSHAVDVADASPSADDRLMEDWMDKRLRAALNALPPLYRMIVVMREIDGLSTREVATIAGVSEAVVKTRLHRARLMLRKKLESA
ncbi:MAG TPA: sigma-70 family RNA polymerase sigma factor [Vicinamibacterales bacterium]|nr:sigma-70 family RNA polymerase sigma factor [Vicinamibacterales bacterium]